MQVCLQDYGRVEARVLILLCVPLNGGSQPSGVVTSQVNSLLTQAVLLLGDSPVTLLFPLTVCTGF